MKVRGVFEEKSNWNILKLLKIKASEYGSKEFIRFDSGSSLSFKLLDELSDCLAYKLLDIGLKEDENVFCLLKNGSEFLISLFAVMKVGAIFVPINTELQGQFLEHQFHNCEPKIAIIDNRLIDVFKDIKPQKKALKATIVTGSFVDSPFPKALNTDLFVSFDDCLKTSNPNNADLSENTSIHKVCAIMYTSGTTGPSKGVLLTHGHFFSYSIISAEVQRLTNKDTYYICMPLFHINALSIQCFAALYAGMNVYCVERFSPNRWLQDNINCKATVTNLLGVMTEFIFNTAESDLDKDHSLRHVGAVPIGAEWGEKFENRFNIKFFQGFGMTESGMSFYEKISSDKTIPGCAGYPIEELYEVKIANPENDETLPCNKIGELLIRPKYPGIFSAGYYKMPDKTVEAWRNLWFHTGDACFFDEKGRMHYFDRIKDCIRRRGENISAFELEQVINSYPEVEESAAIGVKTEKSGGEDEVLVCIVKNKGANIENDKFLLFCQEKLPRFAVPKYIRYVESIRKTGSGKLSKVDVRNEGLTNDVITLTPDR